MSAPALSQVPKLASTQLSLFDTFLGPWLGPHIEWGIISSSGNTTLTDQNKNWPINVWLNFNVLILSGIGIGQMRTVTSNTSNTLTLASAWSINPDSFAIYKIIILPQWESATYPNLRTSIWNSGSEAMVQAPQDGQSQGNSALITVAYQSAYNGGSFDKIRTPNIFKTADVSALGNTTVWTPGAGKKFRLMGGVISIDATCILAVAGSELITLTDSGTAIGIGFRNFIPAAAGTLQGQDVYIPIGPLGNGFLSAAANNLLQVNLGTALSAGNIRVSVWGTEE